MPQLCSNTERKMPICRLANQNHQEHLPFKSGKSRLSQQHKYFCSFFMNLSPLSLLKNGTMSKTVILFFFFLLPCFLPFFLFESWRTDKNVSIQWSFSCLLAHIKCHLRCLINACLGLIVMFNQYFRKYWGRGEVKQDVLKALAWTSTPQFVPFLIFFFWCPLSF